MAGLCVLADDPFSSGDPFTNQKSASPKMGVTRMTIAKPTPRSQTLAETSYQNIEAKLSSKTAIRVKEMPLSKVMHEISQAHQIPIFPQRRALKKAKVSLETPVTIDVRSVSLRTGLNLLLSKVGLDYIVKDEVLQYTTKDDALRQAVKLKYQLPDENETGIQQLAESIQALLAQEHKSPMPEPIVETSKDTKPNETRTILVVTCSYRMHAIVRDYLCKGAASDSEIAPRGDAKH
jgi:hypothetical protein